MLRGLELVRTIGRLGLPSVVRVGAYRALLRVGWYARRHPVGAPVRGPFFEWGAASAPSVPPSIDPEPWVLDAKRVLSGEVPAFSNAWVEVGFPPSWRRSVLTGVDLEEPRRHWTRIPDFALAGGDVKGFWEPARFDGLLHLTLGWLAGGGEAERAGVERWLESWVEENPVNAGVQWKCGQETSLRLMAILLCTHLLKRWGGVRAAPGLHDLVAEHASRIAATMSYAIGQDNNHATSEAAALFAAGAFLMAEGAHGDVGRRWVGSGRSSLEERVQALVMPDGSFSQHSVNYHRMLLDTVSFAETWRRAYHLEPFTRAFDSRCRAATEWLGGLTEPASGDAPNLGANDGTRLFVLHRLPYRDFRPSVQWASALFFERAAYARGPWDEGLRWLGIVAPDEGSTRAAPYTRLMPDGGYAQLEAGGAWALLRLPVYRFRPSHADALHLDLWVGGVNLLRDGGSYSYNTDPGRWAYYTGAASHNTIQIDGRDQMPRISRFLFGDWLRPAELTFDASALTCRAAYRDRGGALHRRTVRLEEGRCSVEDEVSGFERSAVLRWRLALVDWRPFASGAASDLARVTVTANVPLARLAIVEGVESRHYGEERVLPVLEAEVGAAARLCTEITWAA